MSVSAESGARRPSRLQPIEPASIAPFFRSEELESASLYWLPVSGFPLAWMQRQWLLVFINRLRDLLAREERLDLATFLQLKSLNQQNTDLFLSRKLLYSPLTGIALRPDAGLPTPPTNDELKEEIEANPGNLDVAKYMPDLTYWLLSGNDEEQRQDFFGLGHMTLLFLPSDQKVPVPKLFMPKILRTHPAMQDNKVQEQMKIVAAMQHPFLKQSKEVFGGGLRDHHIFPGVPFILPFFSSADFLNAGEQILERWFSVFRAYLVESPADKGILLALDDPAFDDRLIPLLRQMRDDGLTYPV